MATWVSWYQNVKLFWVVLQQEMLEVGGGWYPDSWICRSFARSSNQSTVTNIPTLCC